MKTIDEIKNEFDTNGLSVAEWSRQHGFPYQSVQQVLQCQRQFKFDPFRSEFGNLNLTPL